MMHPATPARRDVRLLLLSVALVGACESRARAIVGTDAGASVSTVASRWVDLRESSRDVVARNCGECHTRHLETAVARALRVFDVTELDWSQRMTEAQLRDAERRLAQPDVPTRGNDDVRPLKVTADELRLFHEYVELTLERRNGNERSGDR